MALSTSIPSASVSENSTTMLSVIPRACRIIKVRNMEKGMDRPTKMAFRAPITNNSTTTTRMSPEMILFSRSETIIRMSLDLSISFVMVVPTGQVGFRAFRTSSSRSVMARTFSPARFFTMILTAVRPSSRARPASSLNPSTTRATFFR